jgi:4-hydroxy-3-polyprenylbenzoate decarboxylase
MTGSSGAIYGLRLVEELRKRDVRVELVLSEPARRVLHYEEGFAFPEGDLQVEDLFADPKGIALHDPREVEAAPSSGSAGIDAVVVCPCSMGTLGRISHGYSIGLIERAADVALKEGRTLLLVPRETPLNLIHLENMLQVAKAGAIILPASPGFYQRPQTLEDLVNFVVGKILDRLGFDASELTHWDTPLSKEVEKTSEDPGDGGKT